MDDARLRIRVNTYKTKEVIGNNLMIRRRSRLFFYLQLALYQIYYKNDLDVNEVCTSILRFS